MTAHATCDCGWAESGSLSVVTPSAHVHVCGARHGTLTGYSATGCRCTACRTVAVRYNKRLRYHHASGGAPRLVDSAPARAHVEQLLAAGVSFRAISLAAGWRSRNSLDEALKRDRVNHRTLARILAVTADCDTRSTGYVDATGSRRRLRALSANGWTSRALAQQLGHADHSTVLEVRSGSTLTIRRFTADAVRGLYDRLWDVDGGSARARRHAQRHGWPVPLAWDDDTIDDPTATPYAGQDDGGCHVCEDIDHLLGAGEHPVAVAERLSRKHDSLLSHVRRHARPDLTERLNLNRTRGIPA